MIEALANQIGDFEREYIFINDGSSDESLALLNAHQNKLPNCRIITKSNEGPSKALNLGISLANNEMVKFVDGDDILLPHATIALLDTYVSSEVKVVFGKLSTYKPFQELNLINYSADYLPGKTIKDPFEKIIKGGVSGISSIGMTRGLASLELLKKVGVADEKVFIQDYSVSLRLASLTNFAYVDSIIALQANDVSTNHISYDSIQERYDSILALYYFCKEYPEIATIHACSINIRIKKIVAKLAKIHHLNFMTHYVVYLKAKFITKLNYEELLYEVRAASEWADHHFANQIRKMPRN